MSTDHKEPNYMAIFWWLLALTILEVLAAISPIVQGAKAALLVSMALAKVILVAMYFMHLRFETRTMAAIVVTPLILCVFLLAGSAVAGGWSIWSNRRLMKRVRAEGYAVCPVCGYNLRDLPDEHTCPECGLVYHLKVIERVWTDWIHICEFRWR